MKKHEPTPETIHHSADQHSSGLAVSSLVLGILSLTGFGLILGIPAIITGVMALRRSHTDQGLSWTGIITGIISTIVSLLVLLFFIVLIIIAMVAGQNTVPGSDVPIPDDIQSIESA